MSALTVCGCLVCLAGCPPGQAAGLGPNLLANGDFESGPWRAEGDLRAAQVDMMVSHRGLQSGKLTAKPDREVYVYGPAFDLDPTKTYVLTAWIKTEGVTDPRGAHVRVLQWDGKEPVGWVCNWEIGQGVNQFLQTGGRHRWRRLSGLLTKLNPRAERGVPFFAIAAGQGTAWLDDGEVREWKGDRLPPELAQPIDEPGTRPGPAGEPETPAGVPPEFDLPHLSFPPRVPAGPNTLENGDFEQLPPSDWVKTVSLDTQVKHGGAAALALDVAESGMVATAKEVDAAFDYRLTLWLKTEMVPPDGLKLRLWPGWWNEATMSETLISTGGTQDWTRHEIVLTDLPPSLDGKRWWLHYSLQAAEEGRPRPRAWIDDAEIVPLADSFRVSSSRTGNFLLEGEDARLTVGVRGIPAGASRRLKWATTDFWGRLVGAKTQPLAADGVGSAEVRIALPGRGYAGMALIVEDEASRPLVGRRISAAVLPPPPTDASAPKPESIFACWGVNPELAPRLGVKWNRWMERPVYFAPVEGKPGEFDWTLKPYYGDYRPHEDRLKERQAGLMTYLCFGQFADWMLKGPDGTRSPVPRDWDRFADWVAFVYRQVADVVPVVEVWNEPVIPWGWSGTPEDIVTLHRVVYETVKRINPQVTVLGPCDSTEHLDTFGRLGGFQWVDAVSIHPYRQDSPEASDFTGELRRVREIAAKYGPAKEIWITEMGWTTAPGYFTELEQANWEARAYLLAMSQGVRNLNVHIFADWNNPSPSEKYYGIVRTDRTPKPAAVAYATVTRNLEGAKYVGAIDGLGRASYGFVFERNEQPLLVLWNATVDGVPARVRVGTGKVSVERLDGNVQQVSTTNGVLDTNLGPSPVFVQGVDPGLYLPQPHAGLVIGGKG